MLQEHEIALAPLLTRQSVKALGDVGPTAAEIDAILHASVTVPDHGTLRPWRLVVVEGEARRAFGEALAAAGREANPGFTDELAERLRSKAFAAPTLIAVVARIDPDAKIAVWEQVASAACAGYAITLAAHQLGVGAIWKSSPHQEGEALRRTLDMGPADQFLGWVNLGQIPVERPTSSRAAVDLTPIVRHLGADGLARVAG
ncbi:MAG: putative nitroreductase [Ilumatobacteraceae bacterium]|nr:putative nitroreductase [Ilumatobacteraceae bacterium]